MAGQRTSPRQRQAAAAVATERGIAVRPPGDRQPLRRSTRSAGTHISSASARRLLLPIARLVRVLHCGHGASHNLRHVSMCTCNAYVCVLFVYICNSAPQDRNINTGLPDTFRGQGELAVRVQCIVTCAYVI